MYPVRRRLAQVRYHVLGELVALTLFWVYPRG